MSAHTQLNSDPGAGWFEEQIARLKGRSLLFRDDELCALRESANLIDSYVARQSAMGDNADSPIFELRSVLLKKILAQLRKRQRRRPADPARLVQFREQAIAFRKLQMKRGKLKRWLDAARGISLKNRLQNLECAWLKINRRRAGLYRRAVLRLLMLVALDAYACGHHSHPNIHIDSILKLLMYRSRLQKKLTMYEQISSKLRADAAVVGTLNNAPVTNLT